MTHVRSCTNTGAPVNKDGHALVSMLHKYRRTSEQGRASSSEYAAQSTSEPYD